MFDKNLIKIINEEVSNFDFLGNDKYSKERESVDLLLTEDFQKQFICDSLINKGKISFRIVDSNLKGNYADDTSNESTYLSLEYFLRISYKYDQTKEPVMFDLNFSSDNIDYSKDTSASDNGYDTAPSGEDWFNRFNWKDISVNLNTVEGDDVKFIAFEKAPDKIKMLFVREYIETYIEKYTGMEIRTPESKIDINNTQYC